MSNFSGKSIIILTAGILLLMVSCRKQYQATEEDMADYGWLLFENSAGRTDYDDSKSWFLSSVSDDTTYMDGYNGLGWTNGKLTDLDSSLYYFERGLNFSQSIFDTTNVKHEIWAGLCFANNAKGYDSIAIIWGDSLISVTSGLAFLPWTFSHNNINSNNIINHLDVRITLAASNFAIGRFDNSLTHLQKILSELESNTTLNSDVNTVAGRAELAVWIDSLQTELLKR